jgi:hypothetical protein
MTSQFFPESRAIYEIIWENTVHPDRPQIAVRHMSFACWITKATDKNSGNVLIIAFP